MKKALRYLVLSALGAVFLIPFLWMLSTSLTPAAEVMAKHRSWIPTHPQWSNYPEALTVLPFQIFLKNTLIVTVLAIICLLYTSPSPRDRTRSRMPSSA